jgi:N-acyl-D-amino-acid deacylase
MTDAPSRHFDLIIRNGTVYDGDGAGGVATNLAVSADRIAVIGPLGDAKADIEIDAAGLAVAPGFVNMLSHSYISLLQDPRGLSELKQGVTLQIFGEGNSMGPLSDEMHQRMQKNLHEGDLPVDAPWRSLAEYLAYAESFGVSQNVASYIGATTIRQHVIGNDNRPPTAAELDRMCGLVRDEMAAGALGIGSSLIYPPAFFASTEELVALCKASSPFDGKYISHMRNESEGLLEAIDELLTISRDGEVPAEIYHLKAAGEASWHLMDQAIATVEEARAKGERISADMYTYTAGATGLSNCIPPWFHDGGPQKLFERLEDPAIRKEIRKTIETTSTGWENLYGRCRGPEDVLILSVRKPENRIYQGKNLAQVSEMLGVDPIDAIMDLVTMDRSRITTAYFMIGEDNVRKQVQLPWMSFGSDSPAVAAEGDFLSASTHPRAYGTFARLLGHYSRDEGLVPLAEAIRRLASLPCDNLGFKDRGRLTPGYYADIVVFDPATIADTATYEQPHSYAVGVRDVIVNGVPALRDGEHTGAHPGRAVYGPGKR